MVEDIATKRQFKAAGALVMTKPDPQFRYNPFLAIRAATHYLNTGELLTPDAAADVDLDWETDVFTTAMGWIKYWEDYSKRPAAMQ